MARNDATKHGVRPARGLWLVSPSRRIAYGPILMVRPSTIRWESQRYGHGVETSHEVIHHGDYGYEEAGTEGGIPAGFTLLNIDDDKYINQRSTKKP